MAFTNALLESICPATGPAPPPPSSLASTIVKVFGVAFIVLLGICAIDVLKHIREGTFDSMHRFQNRTEGITWEWRAGKLIERKIEQNQEWTEVDTDEVEEDDDVDAKLSRLEDAMEEVRFATEELRYATESYDWEPTEDEN